MNWEIFGYIGTVLILVSFLIENVYKLRLVNTIGAIFWLVYGIGIMAKPTIVVNLAVIIIHGIWFIKQKKEPK
jgi:4-amino-4-deoxy-L-arabinose transferase-like glycosyltransferase